jgi:branched-chain amino acid aminotransferase
LIPQEKDTIMTTETQPFHSPPAGLTDDSIVFFDGRLLPLSQATVSIAAHALHYGTGCFEGIRAYWSEESGELYALKLREHVDRFYRSCSVLRIQPPFSREELCDIIVDMLRQNGYRSNVYIRPIAFKSSRTIKLTLSTLDDSFAVFAFPFGHYAHREGGLRVGFSPWRRVEDNIIPARAKITGGYVNASLASDDAARAGYDEALMLNTDGTVSEASSSNIFLIRAGRLITPAVSENILEGITRDAVIELAARELGMAVDEREVGRSEVYTADEVFLTGTGVQIEPVVEVDGRPVGIGIPGPVTERLAALYAAAVRNQVPAYSAWCTPVYRPHHGPGD